MDFIASNPLLLVSLALTGVYFITTGIAQSYRKALKKYAEAGGFNYIEGRNVPHLGAVDNFYFMPFIPLGHCHKETEHAHIYFFVTNTGKRLFMNTALVAKKPVKDEFSLSPAGIFGGNADTGLALDKHYTLKGPSADGFRQLLHNMPTLAQYLADQGKDGRDTKVWCSNEQLAVRQYKQFMLIYDPLPEVQQLFWHFEPLFKAL